MGKVFGHGGAYHTDGLEAKAADFIRRMRGKRRAFFMYVATRWPHWPADPAPRHADAFPQRQGAAPAFVTRLGTDS
jgi:hypothetical protein